MSHPRRDENAFGASSAAVYHSKVLGVKGIQSKVFLSQRYFQSKVLHLFWDDLPKVSMHPNLHDPSAAVITQRYMRMTAITRGVTTA